MTFEWPLLLALLALIPLLFLFYVLAQRRRRAYAVRFTNLALLSQVVGKGPGVKRHIPPIIYLLGLTALLISMARPVAVLAMPQEQSAVMLVMDVSGSMAADDLQPNRMEAARSAARAFVNALPEHVQVGVVSFSEAASLNAPLSRDRDQALRAIDNLRASGGTAIGEGLVRALEHLDQRPLDAQGQRAPAQVVLLSDGVSAAGISPAEAATQAANAGVTVSTVGIGERGASPELRSGQRVGLDETALRNIAEQTGGQYFYAAEAGQLERIYASLGSQVSWVTERTEITALVAGLGALFLLVGGLLGLRWFQQFP
ncbi:MAG: VWA domain-containing protein [Chloroflexaceae bacterium]|jgi:Ca-activated chloride channel family protein|nr:VWA domain-containing protein [Chloroflexaceae bacterium]